MAFTPPKRERVVIYWPTAVEPDAYKQMIQWIEKSYYWVDLVGEVRGRENINDLFTMALEAKFDVLLIEHLKHLGPTVTTRVATTAAMAHANIRVMAFWDLSFDEIPNEYVRLFCTGLMQENVVFHYYERTKERQGRGIPRRVYKKPRKKRVDAGLPRKTRTPEQEAWVKEQAAKYRNDEWRVKKEYWAQRDAMRKEEAQKRREARVKAKKALTQTSQDDSV